MDRLLATLVSRSIRRGLRGEPVWLAIGVGAWLVRRSRRRGDEALWTGRIRPGQRLEIRAYDPRTEGRGAPAEV